MSREDVVAAANAYFDDGYFLDDLTRRIAIPSESQKTDSRAALDQYLNDEMVPAFEAMGHDCQVFENPIEGKGPVLLIYA